MKITISDEIEIRPFVEDDRYAVASLIREILAEYGLLQGSADLTAEMARLSKRYSEDTSAFWVLLYNNEVFGTAGIRPHGEYTAEIERLYLRRKLRGRGIGTEFLNFLEDSAYKMGYRRLFISCPRAMDKGIIFLENQDYRKVGNAEQLSEVELFEKELF